MVSCLSQIPQSPGQGPREGGREGSGQGSLNSVPPRCCHSLADGTTGVILAPAGINPQLQQLELELLANTPWLLLGRGVAAMSCKPFAGEGLWRCQDTQRSFWECLASGAFPWKRGAGCSARLLQHRTNHESSRGLYLENTLLVSVIKPM